MDKFELWEMIINENSIVAEKPISNISAPSAADVWEMINNENFKEKGNPLHRTTPMIYNDEFILDINEQKPLQLEQSFVNFKKMHICLFGIVWLEIILLCYLFTFIK
jgi:hypothetical protein